MTHWVYVIELDPAVVRNRSFRKQNPHWEDAERFFYVGETAKDPKERFEQHMEGGRLAAPIVKRYGRWLIPRRCRQCRDRSEGRQLERSTAQKIRGQGHAAYFN